MKILFITLSNIGDVILTLPVLDALIENNGHSQITVLTGPRAKEIFQNNPLINKVIVFDKHTKLKDKIKLFKSINKEKFDQVVDLRNMFFSLLLSGKRKISPFKIIPNSIRHMKDQHLFKAGLKSSSLKSALYVDKKTDEVVDRLLNDNSILIEDKFILVSPGARSSTKTWAKEKFSEFINRFIEEFKLKVILVGDSQDSSICKAIKENSKYILVDLCNKTSILELAAIVKRSSLVVANDSAVLHIAGYFDIPTVAIFGPTDDLKYGPWSQNKAIAKKDISCRPCEKAQCKFGTLDCLKLVSPNDLILRVRNILNGKNLKINKPYKRILIARTDRIGDVLLSTPAIKAVRENYPDSYIAVLVSPYARQIVEGNPYLDEVIVYDKDKLHHGWMRSMKFSRFLRKKKFDLALILHPVNRMHLITFFAGIHRRVGYDRKFSSLLTDKIKHSKHLGQKHEMEYTLDLVRYLGIEPTAKYLYMPIKKESEEKIDKLFDALEICKTDKLLAIHPAASCPSKVWPNDRFAVVADKLMEKYGFKVLILAAAKDRALAQAVEKHMSHKAINLAGQTSVSELASILKRCCLFISNDSGPVHIATALGTPVISIFGRNQMGLSPLRWGPLGPNGRVIHKNVGCVECLAHNCLKEFACLKAIKAEDVIVIADEILKK